MAADRPARAYLDYNATAPLRPESRAAVVAALDTVGNPSSVHAEGRAARQIVERARAEVGRLAGVPARCVTFLSGATEAANAALNPRLGLTAAEAALDRLIVSAGEHPCVLQGHRFPAAAVEVAPLRPDGRIDLDGLREACRRPGRALLALQGANNETGVVQPVAEAAAIVRAAGGRVFCDAVQLAGKAPFSPASLGADVLAVSAHKLGGPKGVGALIAASAGTGLGDPFLRGGGQERGARAGTENVASIAGFGAAAAAAMPGMAEEALRLEALRRGLADAVRAACPDAVLFGEGAPRLPNTLCFAAPGLEASTLMIALDLAGIAVSSGSACASGKVAPSHVLAAMGVEPALARAAIRLSLGWASTVVDVERFADAFASAVRRIRAGRAPAPGPRRDADLAPAAGRV